jgi:hypothetical protein
LKNRQSQRFSEPSALLPIKRRAVLLYRSSGMILVISFIAYLRCGAVIRRAQKS